MALTNGFHWGGYKPLISRVITPVNGLTNRFHWGVITTYGPLLITAASWAHLAFFAVAKGHGQSTILLSKATGEAIEMNPKFASVFVELS